MSNPFFRRATEYIRDDSAFLSIVSPDPLTTFIGRHPKRDALFDLPARVIGSPGSGKTMMATLLEFRLLEAVLRDQSNDNNRELAAAFATSGFSEGGYPLVAAVRLPLEFQYRDFWELPYDDVLKTKLMLSLVQARAVLGLCRHLTANNRRPLSAIKFIPRENVEAQLEGIGGRTIEGIRARAHEVERAVYGISAGLLAPSVEDIPAAARDPYEPFRVIREIELDWDGVSRRVKPLVILDDAHTLHPRQFEELFRALAGREMQVGRWLMMRMDTLSPATVFQSTKEDAFPGLKAERDYIDIFMQPHGDRTAERRTFRRMAANMADRYLARVTSLRDRNFTQFSRLVPAEPPLLPSGKIEELRNLLDRDQKRFSVTPNRRKEFEAKVTKYAKGSKSSDVGIDVQLAMIRVLMHRYAKRIAPGLFEELDPDPKIQLKADSDVANAARAHLHVLFGRPYHFGFDVICDASSENAELFLHLAGTLVTRMETRIIRNVDPALTPDQQQTELRAKSTEIIEGWSFPFSRNIRLLTSKAAIECVQETNLGNAPLGPGANAVGILEEEMSKLLDTDSELAMTLKFAIAYGAIHAERNYNQGGKLWCLLELSGPVCIRYGLPFNRGGFLERTPRDLENMIRSDGAQAVRVTVGETSTSVVSER